MKHNLLERRAGVLDRFKTQLERGTKPVRKNPGVYSPLTSSDIKRINKDISILEDPVMKYKRKNRKFNQIVKVED